MSFDWDAEVNELFEYRRVEQELPHTCAGSRIRWGDQFVAGLNTLTGQPIWFPWRGLQTNALIEGRPGTGKTVILDAWLSQAIANLSIKKIVHVLYKQSPASIANAVEWAARFGRRCRFVTNDPGKASYGLPLLQTVFDCGLPSFDIASAMVAALGYDYGPGHGEDYYRDVKEIVLATVKATNQLPRGQQTFANFARLMLSMTPQPEFADVFRDGRMQLFKAFTALGSLDCIECQAGVDDRAMIDLREFFTSDEPEILILEMLPEISRINSFLIPQLVAHVHGHVIQGQGDEDEPRVIYFVDEASNFMSKSIGTKMERFRSSGTSFVMAYQHPGQFKQGAHDFTQDMEGNSALKIYLGTENLERFDFLKRFGGEKMAVVSQSFRTEHHPIALDPDHDVEPQSQLPAEYYPQAMMGEAPVRNVVSEAVSNSVGKVSRYSDNDILALFAQQNYGLMRSSVDRDFYQHQGTLIPVFFPFHTSPETYARLRRTPWPTHPGTKPVVYRDVLAEILQPPPPDAPPSGPKKGFSGEDWADTIKEITRQQREREEKRKKPPKPGGGQQGGGGTT